MNVHVLISGTSTRAAAESAARAGFRVTSIDAYADRDQHPSVRALSLPRDYGRGFTCAAAARVSRSIDADAVTYLSGFENDPSAVATLARGRRLWGNPPDVLARVRNPFALAAALRARGFIVPALRAGASTAASSNGDGSRMQNGDGAEAATPAAANSAVEAWVVKPLRSGGGRRIRRWRGERVARDCYLQQWIGGTAASVVFIAVRGHAVPLGLSRQLCGDAAFGAVGHGYCGSILAVDALAEGGIRLLERACGLAEAAAAEFALTGMNGVDFIAREGVPYPIEINPRWSASMELVERLFGLSVFAAHAAAFEREALPRYDAIEALRRSGAAGKAIVFARWDVVTGDTTRWLKEATIRDVPHPGERIAAGQPVCTVLADSRDARGCYAALVNGAERIYQELDAWRTAASRPRDHRPYV